jgi:uncharacterized protein YprB with RNaseH-like and TPR domain
MDLEKRLYEALKRHIENPRAPEPDLFKTPPVGSIRQTDLGPVWMVETAYDEGYLHGRVEISPAIQSGALGILDSVASGGAAKPATMAVIDTETTGLAGGTGTYAFIMGIGFWSHNRFIVRQYILRDFSEEPAQLMALADDFKRTSSILTYNGKTFDIPLLRTRYRINRLEIPFTDHVHLDLVHPCRRLYKRHFDSFNLSFLEIKLLGFERADDVPPHLIPRIYFDYLQNRDDSVLLPILNHNRDDILSLYGLAQETSRRIDLALSHCCDDDMLLLSLGQIMFKTGEYAKSMDLLSSIKLQFAPRDVADESLMLKSLTAKKIRDWPTAIETWREMQKAGRFGFYPHIELAKHHEHRLRDFKTALDLTNMAFKLVEFEREFASPSAYEGQLATLRRRRIRLLKRLASNDSD